MEEDFSKLPSRMKDAKLAGSRFYFTGKPCKRGHTDKRYTTTGDCVECLKQKGSDKYTKDRDGILERNKKWRDKNKDYLRSKGKEYRIRDKERLKVYFKKYHEENRELVNLRVAQWKKDNPEKHRENCRNWEKKNLHKMNKKSSKRRAEKLKRTLKFSDDHFSELNEACMEEVYLQRQELQEQFEEIYHVDHVVPLQGALISGLHVWYNLEVLTGFDNDSKGNKFTPYQINHITGKTKYVEENLDA